MYDMTRNEAKTILRNPDATSEQREEARRYLNTTTPTMSLKAIYAYEDAAVVAA